MFKKLTVFVDSKLRRTFEEREDLRTTQWPAFAAALRLPSDLCLHLIQEPYQAALEGFVHSAPHVSGQDFQPENQRSLKLYTALHQAVRIEATIASHYEFDVVVTISFFPKGTETKPLHKLVVGFYSDGQGHSPDVQ